MAREKSKAKLRKLNFVNRERTIEPMTLNDKYLLETIDSPFLIRYVSDNTLTSKGFFSISSIR